MYIQDLSFLLVYYINNEKYNNEIVILLARIKFVCVVECELNSMYTERSIAFEFLCGLYLFLLIIILGINYIHQSDCLLDMLILLSA